MSFASAVVSDMMRTQKKERLDFSNRSGGIYVDMQEKGCMIQLYLNDLHVSDY